MLYLIVLLTCNIACQMAFVKYANEDVEKIWCSTGGVHCNKIWVTFLVLDFYVVAVISDLGLNFTKL